MPEGPSIVILKEEVLPFKGKKVLQVSGNSKIGIERLKNKTVTDFKTWGKHFLICFKGFTVRIHLMLFGSYRINEEKNTRPRLSLKFKNGELNFYACSVKFIEGDLNTEYDWEVDTMSEQWNPQKALASLKQLKNTMACDALLDQHIFAGSGNIIKNEVLYLTKLHPESRVQEIPASKQKEIIKTLRNYCFDFYRWKKNYELKKHWKAHKQKTCERCNIPLLLKHTGKLKRRSFFCDNCQKLYA